MFELSNYVFISKTPGKKSVAWKRTDEEEKERKGKSAGEKLD